jgi:sarcosine oxidase, subunit alpha
MPEGPEAGVRYRGRPIAVRPPETLAQALARRPVGILGRSIRYHRPRAPFCGVGYCTSCLVRVNGRPNVRACQYRPSPGDSVETENAWPSPRFDLLGILDLVFAHGIDTLRGFRRPRWAVPAYQRVVRRLAGFGSLAEPSVTPPPPGEERTTELLIVGGGRSGRALVQTLAERPRGALVLERGLAPAVAGVEIIDRTTAVFLPPPSAGPSKGFVALAAREDGRGVRIRARSVVVATGGYDANLLFAGNDRPGVVTAEAVAALSPGEGRPGFRRAVVFGAGERAETLLDRFGEQVEAVVAPGSFGPALVRQASDLGIPLYPRTLLVEAVGPRRVRSVRLVRRGTGEPISVAADAVVIAHRRLPNPQLYFQANARMQWRSETGAYYPVLSDRFETTVPGLYAIGGSAGFVGPASIESGRRLAGILDGAAPPAPPLPRVGDGAPNELEGYLRELVGYLPRRSKTMACACEDVLLRELEEAPERGYRGIEVAKRYTGLGTGLCQGRYCLPDAILLLSIWEGRAPAEVGYITQRPPVAPAPLSAFAGLPPAPEGEGA